jgi:hypothetical protein
MKNILLQSAKAASLASLALVLAQPVHAQKPAAAQPVHAQEEEATKPAPHGSDGIKVHGHWVIDIKNPDGTLAKHLDFQNSLTTAPATGTYGGSTGDQLLVALLSGVAVSSAPGIGVIQAPAPGNTIAAGQAIAEFCTKGLPGATGYSCGILTTAQSLTAYSNFYLPLSTQTGLTSTVNFTSPVSWVLAGNFTVPATGFSSLTAVQTLLPVCLANYNFIWASEPLNPLQGSGPAVLSNTSPSACNLANAQAGGGAEPNPSFGPFTQTVVPGAPVALTPN